MTRTLTLDDIRAMDEPITLDIGTITLGESIIAERESGMTISEIVSSRTAQRVLAMLVYGLRSYDVRPSWSELASLRVLDVSRSTSRRPGDGVSETSTALPSERSGT